MEITKITIYSRGKNKDEFGNPYHAFKAILDTKNKSYHSQIIVTRNMAWGDATEYDCLKWAVWGINEALGYDLKPSDERIEHHYKTVYRDSDLEHPENWRV